MIIQDLLPLLAAKGLATDRIALIGWSMGGYGALLLASRLGPSRVAGVAAASAALWQSPGDSAPGAFDDSLDFARNDVFARRSVLATYSHGEACWPRYRSVWTADVMTRSSWPTGRWRAHYPRPPPSTRGRTPRSTGRLTPAPR